MSILRKFYKLSLFVIYFEMKKDFLFLLLISYAFFISCKTEDENPVIRLYGNVFGTTYHITYLSEENYQKQIDSLFYLVNKSLSTYLPTSDISKINKGDTTVIVDAYFKEVFNKSQRIYKETDGFFDPTVGNLVNAWGFGPKNEMRNLDTSEVKKQLKFVGFDKVWIKNGKVKKKKPKIYLDFNASAKGFGIDVISRFLERKNIDNYLVEIGGEIRAKGKNEKQKWWSVAIENPNTDGTQSYQKIIELDNKSMATSGNYRKFRMTKEGNKIVHTINPKTGFASESNLLSVSVIADLDCADVDAYATAFMAMGLEKTRQFLTEHSAISAIVIFEDTHQKIQILTINNTTY